MAKKMILIVDDETVIVYSIKNFILKCSDQYEIETAYNGKEAMAILERKNIDLMILDLNMPVMDGIQVLVELHNRNIWLPVIILTKVLIVTANHEGDIFGEFGIIDYMEKPVDFEKLYKKIETVLNRFEVIKKSTSGIGLSKILEVVKMERKTGVLTVRTGKDDGRIFFRDGDVVDAEFKGLPPEDAIAACVKPGEEEKIISIEYLNHKRENKIGP